MAFPTFGYALGENTEDAEEAYTTWAAVALAVAEFEPVTMVVDPADLARARDLLGSSVEYVEQPLDDAWMRDIGPSFVFDEHGELGAVDWVFNGWGQQDWASWDRDARVAAAVAERAGVECVNSWLVNEGGGIQVDGRGTVLLTETVQLDPLRNPGATRHQVEAELARTIGASTTIWLPRGLTRDAQRFGTKGHADMLATFTGNGTVLVHCQRDTAHPDHVICQEIRQVLEQSHKADGSLLSLVDLPAPGVLRDEQGWVDYSYINHLVVNGGVIACAFDDPADARAREILRTAYPGREVVTVDARPLFARGGGIHCITQQQPRSSAQ